MPRAQSGRKRLAVYARQLALEPRLQILRRSRRPLLQRLEQARRSALAHHVHRTAPMGAPVLIGSWYYTLVRIALALALASAALGFGTQSRADPLITQGIGISNCAKLAADLKPSAGHDHQANYLLFNFINY